MKELLIIIDGMDDEAIPQLNGATPVAAACMPALNFMRRNGRSFHEISVPDGIEPATDTALLSILGYDLTGNLSSRSHFEALGEGIELEDTDLCLRCNLISHNDGVITSHCAEGITPEECHHAIAILKERFDDESLRFYSSGNFRNLLILKDCTARIAVTGPHNLIGATLSSLHIESDDTILKETLNRVVRESAVLLQNYKANGIALWSPGVAPKINHKIKGALIAGVPLVKGIAKAVGLTFFKAVGTTGDENTNLSAKLDAVFSALSQEDFVILHIEAPDELSHKRDWQGKLKFLEKIDSEVLQPLLEKANDVKIRVRADHATSSLSGRHLAIPVEVTEFTVVK